MGIVCGPVTWARLRQVPGDFRKPQLVTFYIHENLYFISFPTTKGQSSNCECRIILHWKADKVKLSLEN